MADGESLEPEDDQFIHSGWFSFPAGKRLWSCSPTCSHPEHSGSITTEEVQ